MPHKILICDDELHILKAAEIKLRRGGFDVTCSHDGQQGWELMQQVEADVVVTDCQMPRMNGYELCEKIRQDGRFDHLPIFMLTAKGFELDRDEMAEKWGVRKVICKPFSPRELLQLVQEALGIVPEPV